MRAFVAEHPDLFDEKHVAQLVAYGVAHGLNSAFLGSISPDQIEVHDTNYRETYLACGFNARQRALLDELHGLIGHRSIYDVSIYAHEALTPLALTLRGRYPRFLGSEYAPKDADRKRIFPVPSIDITASGLPDASFDIILSGDVLEHVPDLQAALRDSARILKPGGHLIASMPFAYGHEETTPKARLVDGDIEYLTTPEYHGNPMDPSGGSLVFQIPGWSILKDARNAGFADARIVFWSSASRGFAGDPNLGGIMLMVATAA
jgi:SAM-dependent methyltransferase